MEGANSSVLRILKDVELFLLTEILSGADAGNF